MQHKTFNLSKVSLLTLSALSLLATTAQAAPQKSPITLEVNETKAVEPPTRFIVKYKNAATLSAQGLASTATSSVNQLKTHAASELSSRAGEPMSFVRSLAVANRHVVKAERRLLLFRQRPPIFPRSLQQCIGANDISLDKGCRTIDRTINMRHGSQEHDCVRLIDF